jgi:cobalt-zinc-cadmium efflux system protein
VAGRQAQGRTTVRRDHTTRWWEQRRLLIAIGLTAVMLVAEAVGGLYAGSLALLSDAGHMFTDLSALLLALLALAFATRPASRRRTYGWYRLEILSALVNALLLLGICAFIFHEAYGRIRSPHPVHSGTVLVVATLGLGVNAIAYFILSRSRESLNLRGAALHVLGDAISSVGVIASAIVIRMTGWLQADAVASCAIGVVIVVGAFHLLRESIDILLEATPLDIDPLEISEALQSIPGVRGVHDLHVWSITSGMPALSVHLIVDKSWFQNGGRMLLEAKEILVRKFNIEHTTIQVESGNHGDRASVQWKS